MEGIQGNGVVAATWGGGEVLAVKMGVDLDRPYIYIKGKGGGGNERVWVCVDLEESMYVT